MLTKDEILLGIIVPMAVSALLAAIGAWRKWAWSMPLAAGVGFFVSYTCFGRPKLPPINGSDWLYWLAIPLIALGVIDPLLGKGRGWLLAGSAVAVAVVIARPLALLPPTPNGVTWPMVWTTAAVTGAAAIVQASVAGIVQKRVGSLWVVMSLCVAVGGAGVVILSSNTRTIGVYGIAAAAALGPVAVLGMRMRGAQSVAVFTAPLLAGLLVAGRFYPEPGVSWTNFGVLLGAPALMLLGAFLPIKRTWMRGVIGLLAVTIAVGAVTGPTALAAKEAAEKAKKDDPLGDLYK